MDNDELQDALAKVVLACLMGVLLIALLGYIILLVTMGKVGWLILILVAASLWATWRLCFR